MGSNQIAYRDSWQNTRKDTAETMYTENSGNDSGSRGKICLIVSVFFLSFVLAKR